MSWRCVCSDCAVWFITVIRLPSSPLGKGGSMRAARSPAASWRAIAVMRVIGRRMARSVSSQADRNRPNATAASSAVSRA